MAGDEDYRVPWGDPDAKTPEQITLDYLMATPKAEVMDAYPQLTDALYERLMKEMDDMANGRANRQSQAGVAIPAIISLGSHHREHRRGSGLVVPRRNPYVIDVKLDD